MFLSIVCPVYRVEKYLPRFLESLENQKFQDFEIVFVYDESPDNSLGLLEDFCKKTLFIDRSKIIINPKKKGVGFAKDLGYKSTSPEAEYVLFLDSDDWLDPLFLLKMVEKAKETSADIVCCGYQRIKEEDGSVLCEEMIHNPEGVLPLRPLSFPIEVINTAAWNKLFRRRVAEKSFFGLASRAEDLYYLLHALQAAKSVTFINEPLYRYFIHPGSLVMTMNHERFSEICSIFASFSSEKNDRSTFELISSFIFVRVGVGSTLRTLQSVPDKREKRRIVRESRSFMKRHFRILGRNRYLALRFLAKAGKKGIALWILKCLYKLRVFGLAATIYERQSKRAKTEVRW